MKKKWLALLLTLVMALSTITPAFATVSGTASGIDRNNDGKFYYVAMGDSITTGFGLPGVDTEDTMDPRVNSPRTSSEAYPYLLAQELFDCLKGQGYLDIASEFSQSAQKFGWSNMSVSGFRIADITGCITNPDTFVPSFFDAEDYNKDINTTIVAEVKNADLITVAIGSNDLMQGSSGDFGDIAGENPVVYMMLSVMLGSFGTMGEAYTFDQMLEDLSEGIVNGEITIAQVLDGIRTLTPDGIEELLCQSAEKAVADYPEMINAIRSINENAQIVCIGTYAPFGNSLTIGDETYTMNHIIEKFMGVIVEAVAESGEPQMVEAVVEEVAPEANLTEVAALDAQMDAAEQSAKPSETLANEWDNAEIAANEPAAENVDEMMQLSTAPMSAAQAKEVNNLWGGNWMNWLNWTQSHVNNWNNWNKSTWQAWAAVAQQTNSIASVVRNQRNAALRGFLSFDNAKALLVRLGIDPELIGSEQDAIALATNIITHYDEWQAALDKFNSLGDDVRMGLMLKILMDDLEYPLMYFLASKPSESAMHQINAGIAACAEEYGALYVDIFDGMPNEANLDPHPYTDGHKYMYEQVKAVLFPEVTIVDGDDAQRVEKVLYGSDMTYAITPDEGTHVESVQVNGNDVTFTDNKVTLTGVKQATKLVVNYAANPVQPPVQPTHPTHPVKPVHPVVHPAHPTMRPTVRHHVSHGIFNLVQTWLRWIPFFGR